MLGFLAILAAATAPLCDVPEASLKAQLALPYAAFDTLEGAQGWRTLNGAGCTDAALALLTRYNDANLAKLRPEERREIQFHMGQALAFAGREPEALPYFEKAAGGDAEWSAYVAATIAFLRHDADALAKARADYAQAAPTSMRLQIIEGFLACPDQPYMKAAYCRM